MNVKPPLLVAYTRQPQPTSAKDQRHSLTPARDENQHRRVFAPEDIVDIIDIYEADHPAEASGAAVKANPGAASYDAVAGFRRIPSCGSLIDTWA